MTKNELEAIRNNITEVRIDYFNEDEQQWYVDVFWKTNNPNDFKEYAIEDEWDVDYSNNPKHYNIRGAVMAYIKPNKQIIYDDKFKDEAIENPQVQEEIDNFIKYYMK